MKLSKYSSFDPKSPTPLALLMSTLSLPVGVAASGLDRVLTVLQTGSEASGALAFAAPFVANKSMFGRIQELRANRKKELDTLKGMVHTNRQYFDRVLGTLNDPGKEKGTLGAAEEVPPKKFNKEEFDKLKKEIMKHNPSSSLLKAMEKVEGMITTTFQSERRTGKDLEKSYQLATEELIKAITSEVGRMTKLIEPSQVNQYAGIFAKLAVELKNWFYEIKLSFEKSKLQGLKHLVFGFGEVLLGIAAGVATCAVGLAMAPFVVASLGVSLATRAASVVAGACLHVFSRVYSLNANIFSQFLSRKKDLTGQSPQSKFDQETEKMIQRLEDRADKFFAQAKKFDPSQSLDDVTQGFKKAKGLFTGARNQSARKSTQQPEPVVTITKEPDSGVRILGGGQGAEGTEERDVADASKSVMAQVGDEMRVGNAQVASVVASGVHKEVVVDPSSEGQTIVRVAEDLQQINSRALALYQLGARLQQADDVERQRDDRGLSNP